MPYDPLTRENVASVIDGCADTPRVPSFIHFWVHAQAFEDRPHVAHYLAQVRRLARGR